MIYYYHIRHIHSGRHTYIKSPNIYSTLEHCAREWKVVKIIDKKEYETKRYGDLLPFKKQIKYSTESDYYKWLASERYT